MAAVLIFAHTQGQDYQHARVPVDTISLTLTIANLSTIVISIMAAVNINVHTPVLEHLTASVKTESLILIETLHITYVMRQLTHVVS